MGILANFVPRLSLEHLLLYEGKVAIGRMGMASDPGAFHIDAASHMAAGWREQGT